MWGGRAQQRCGEDPSCRPRGVCSSPPLSLPPFQYTYPSRTHHAASYVPVVNRRESRCFWRGFILPPGQCCGCNWTRMQSHKNVFITNRASRDQNDDVWSGHSPIARAKQNGSDEVTGRTEERTNGGSRGCKLYMSMALIYPLSDPPRAF